MFELGCWFVCPAVAMLTPASKGFSLELLEPHVFSVCITSDCCMPNEELRRPKSSRGPWANFRPGPQRLNISKTSHIIRAKAKPEVTVSGMSMLGSCYCTLQRFNCAACLEFAVGCAFARFDHHLQHGGWRRSRGLSDENAGTQIVQAGAGALGRCLCSAMRQHLTVDCPG